MLCSGGVWSIAVEEAALRREMRNVLVREMYESRWSGGTASGGRQLAAAAVDVGELTDAANQSPVGLAETRGEASVATT